MKKNLVIFSLTTVVILFFLSKSFNDGGKEALAKTDSGGASLKMREHEELVLRLLNSDIEFWGRVIDQNDQPIQMARIEMTVEGALGKQTYTRLSDEDGRFELSGVKGGKIDVKVTAEGYAPTVSEKLGSDVSERSIYYYLDAMPPYAPPTKDDPQVFMLRKKNLIADLFHFQEKRYPISPNGKDLLVSLKLPGKEVLITIRCWSSCPVPFTYELYDWQCEIEVADGELQAFDNANPFKAPIVDAPTTGYEPNFKLEMPKERDDDWSWHSPPGKRDFWIKFADGSFAKSRIEINTGRKHDVEVELWYNLNRTNNFEQEDQ